MNKAEKHQAAEQQARNRAVKGWAFRDISQKEKEEILRFLAGGPVPPLYAKAYAMARVQLRLGPKDWYEAFADCVHSLGKEWPDDITPEENAYCAASADTYAPRPAAEREGIPCARKDCQAVFDPAKAWFVLPNREVLSGWYYPAGTDTDNDAPPHAHSTEYHSAPE
jgi:hypothetical protein